MVFGKVRAWLSSLSTRSETVAGQVPDIHAPYIQSIDYWKNGATMRLSLDGLRLGRTNAGALELSQAVMSQDGWRGNRTTADVAGEIRAHCVAWFWLPPLRSRANPVDLEFFHTWPRNLLVSFRLKAPGDPEAANQKRRQEGRKE